MIVEIHTLHGAVSRLLRSRTEKLSVITRFDICASDAAYPQRKDKTKSLVAFNEMKYTNVVCVLRSAELGQHIEVGREVGCISKIM